MQANGRQPLRAPDGASVHYERHRPEQTTLYRLEQQHTATFFAQAEAAAGADLPQSVKDECGCSCAKAWCICSATEASLQANAEAHLASR